MKLLEIYMIVRKVRVMYKRTVLWNSIVGSHLWDMNTEGSDTDRFIAFAYPTEVLLKGYNPKMSFFIQSGNTDYAWHEIGVIIAQLIKCNMNFVIGTVSNLADTTGAYHKELQEYVLNHPCKGIYHSIKGMAMHNWKKYIVSGIDTSERRCNKILRVLQFGITLLNTGRYEFKSFSGGDKQLISDKLFELDEAYEKSKLPERMDEKYLRDFLYRVRLNFLNKEGGKDD